MSKTTKANYSDTLTYGNTKYANKNMHMTDKEGYEVLEDEITRTKKMRESKLEKIKRYRELGMSEIFIEPILKGLNLTYTESKNIQLRARIAAEAESKKYREDNPMKEEYVNLIYERFDMWFEKYKDDVRVGGKLQDEVSTGHHFSEPWFWGCTPPGAEKEFYEHIFTEEDHHHKMYFPVFEVCNDKIMKRLYLAGSLEDQGDWE